MPSTCRLGSRQAATSGSNPIRTRLFTYTTWSPCRLHSPSPSLVYKTRQDLRSPACTSILHIRASANAPHHITRNYRRSFESTNTHTPSFDTPTTTPTKYNFADAAHSTSTLLRAASLLQRTSPNSMATTQTANPIYHDPTPGRTRTRRSSSRKSVASSLSRSASHLDSPRAICPKDGDAFSYDPAHLRTWYLPQEIWNRLPAELRSGLAAVQHSGAAVLTGKPRLPCATRHQSHWLHIAQSLHMTYHQHK